MSMKKPFGIRLGDEQRQKLEEIAKAEDRSVSAVMRRFIDEGIKGKCQPNRCEEKKRHE